MDVLVVSANGCRDPMPVLPLGACMAAEAAERAGHRVRLLDLMFRRSPVRTLEAALGANRPDVVGISARNLDNNDFSKPRAYYPELRALAEAAGRRGVPVVLGGSAAGVMPEPLLRAVGCSWAVVGAAEAAFPALLERLASGGDGPLPPGTARRHEGEYAEGPAADPVGAWSGAELGRWLDLGAYGASLASAPVQSKRGCPLGCVYCTYPSLEGRLQRLRPPEEVAEEVERLARAGVRDVEFVDAVFNAPEAHAVAVCEALLRKRLAVALHTSNLNPRFVGRELVEVMARAGFAGIGVSVESASDEALAGLGKGYGADEVRRAAGVLEGVGVPCLWVFLLGGPGETERTLRESLAFAAARRRPRDAVYLSAGVRVYPGTPLEAVARREGVLDTSPREMLRPTFYVSPRLGAERLLTLVRAAVSAHANFVGPGAVPAWGMPVVRGLARLRGWRLPLWQHTRRLRSLLGPFTLAGSGAS